MPTTDGPDYEAKCELCGENPARRSDIEYRASHPDDPWMILCDACDTKTKGRTPPRNGGSNFPGNDEFGPKASARRLEFLKYELRIDTAVYLRLSNKPMPKSFEWMNCLSEGTMHRMLNELHKIKVHYSGLMYAPRGYALAQEGLTCYQTVIGTYQLMAGIGQFSGQRPEQAQEAVPNEA